MVERSSSKSTIFHETTSTVEAYLDFVRSALLAFASWIREDGWSEEQLAAMFLRFRMALLRAVALIVASRDRGLTTEPCGVLGHDIGCGL